MKIKDEITGNMNELPGSGQVMKVYVCGPTVYDSPHLGHLRTYVAFDAMVKYLRHRGVEVFYVQNITDIDDKIINRALELKEDPMELSRQYTEKYMDAMKYAGINSISLYAKATTHIKDIINQIKRLEKKEYTYKLPDGVYFRVWMLKNYGRLRSQEASQQKQGTRATVSDLKEDPRDFALWKFRKDGEPSWRSPWGEGRPGWHVEDTAIALSIFGRKFHLHGAGRDLVFPHNEAELSIMTALKNDPEVCGSWIYTGILKINGEKMSKSLKNFISVEELMEKYSGEESRYAFLSSNYSSEMDFSWEMMEEARKNTSYIQTAYLRLAESKEKGAKIDITAFSKQLYDALEADFNTREAISVIMQLSREIIKNAPLENGSAVKAAKLLKDANTFLGIIPIREAGEIKDSTINSLIRLREDLRNKKMFKESDSVRNALKDSGIILEDGVNGTTWKRE